jgi:predicted RNA-binding protein with RPS1 domain
MPQVGERYLGTVVKTTTFGAFVSLLPGKDGLLHISQIRKIAGGKRVENVEDVLKVGQKVQVEIAEIDSRGKLSSCRCSRTRRKGLMLAETRSRGRPSRSIRAATAVAVVRRSVLPGGLRVVTETVRAVRAATFGVWVGVGSATRSRRLPARHTISSTCSSGHRARNALEISAAIDAVGGEMNAFTAKEYTCYTPGFSTPTCRLPSMSSATW